MVWYDTSYHIGTMSGILTNPPHTIPMPMPMPMLMPSTLPLPPPTPMPMPVPMPVPISSPFHVSASLNSNPTSICMTPSLPSLPLPVRLPVGYSRRPHPHPQPQLTIHSHSNHFSLATRRELEAKRLAEEATLRREITRGEGFSTQPLQSRTRRSSAESALQYQHDRDSHQHQHHHRHDANGINLKLLTSLERRASTGSSIVVESNHVDDSSNSNVRPMDSNGSSTQIPVSTNSSLVSPSPSSTNSPPLSSVAAAVAASPTLAANEAMIVLAKTGSERSDHDIEILFNWIRGQGIEFFAEVDSPTLRLLCARMRSKVCDRREIVMREGTMADALFILISGSVTIWNESFRDHEAIDAKIDQATQKAQLNQPTTGSIHTSFNSQCAGGPDGDGQARYLSDLIRLLGRRPKHITTIHSTSTHKPAFGELGLMSNQLRTATVVAEGPSIAPTSFLIIDKEDFDSVLKRRQKDAFSEKILVLKQLRVFSSVSERQLVKISIYFEERKFPAKTVIIQQGSVSDTIFFLVSGEVEVCETIAIANSVHPLLPSREKVHLGLIGPGELLSDAGVFETPLINPWEIVSTTPVTLFAIPSEEFVKRIRADILMNIRQMSYAKKAIRDELRLKAHRSMKRAHLISPKLQQAQKLLAQISGRPNGNMADNTNRSITSSRSTSSPSTLRSHTHTRPKAIDATVLKNVIVANTADEMKQAANKSGSLTERGIAHPFQSNQFNQPMRSRSSRPSTSPTMSSALQTCESASITGQGLSPANSTTAKTAPHPADSPQNSIHATGTSPLLPSSAASENPSTGLVCPSIESTKGSLLIQRNPFAYDHTTFISPLSADKIASLSASKKDLIHTLTSHSLNNTKPRKQPIQPTTMLTSDTLRLPYPFDHIHASEGVTGESLGQRSTSAHSPRSHPNPSTRRPRHHTRRPSVTLSLGPSNTLSVTMPDGAVHTIEEDGPTTPSQANLSSPRSDERRTSTMISPSTPAPIPAIASPLVIQQSQIHGHSRSISSHRGSVIHPTTLPFAVESDKLKKAQSDKSTLFDTSSQISAPVLISPSRPETLSTSITPAAVIPTSTESVAPVPSFAHLPTNFYSIIPEKQYYGKLELRRPSISIHTGTGSLNPSLSLGHLRSGSIDGFQKAISFPSTTPDDRSPAFITLDRSMNHMRKQASLSLPVTPRSTRHDPTMTPTLTQIINDGPIKETEEAKDEGQDQDNHNNKHDVDDKKASMCETTPSSVRPSTVSSLSSESSLPIRVSPNSVSATSSLNTDTQLVSSQTFNLRSNNFTSIVVAPLPKPLPNSVLVSISDDDVEDNRNGGIFSSPRGIDAPLADTLDTVIDDPLLLDRENRKWDRQMVTWHRKLVVPTPTRTMKMKSKDRSLRRQSNKSPTHRNPLITPDNISQLSLSTSVIPATCTATNTLFVSLPSLFV